MADNVTLPGTGVVVATKDIGSGVELQQVMAGKVALVSATFTRPADTTAYAIGDLVANSTTPGSVALLNLSTALRVAGTGAMLRRLKLRKSSVSITNASFRVHFYAVTETMTVGDNAAIVLPAVADYRGAIDVTIDRAFADGACGFGLPVVGDSIVAAPASGTSLYAVIEARGGYIPASAETFTLEAEFIQD